MMTLVTLVLVKMTTVRQSVWINRLIGAAIRAKTSRSRQSQSLTVPTWMQTQGHHYFSVITASKLI